MEAQREIAPAKINLFLEVAARLPNGYHHLRSLMAFMDVGEYVEATPSDTLSLEIIGPYAGELKADPDNLILRVADVFGEALGHRVNMALRLFKAMPVASGIGGGSADAAATLRLLNRLNGMPLSLEKLADMGASLGADVPACVHSRPVMLDGVGAELSLAEIAENWPCLLVNPNRAVSTVAIFQALDPTDFSPHALSMRTPISLFDIQSRRNDLTRAATDICSNVKDVLDALMQCVGVELVRMSGSGATCFALFSDLQHMQKAEKQLAQAYPHWWGVGGTLTSLLQ